MFKLKLLDFIKGAIMAVLVPALYIIQASIDAGGMVFNWRQIIGASIAGLIGYLLKNLFTNDIKQAQRILSDAKIEGNQAAEPIPPPLEATGFSKPAAPGDKEISNN